jgi:phosphatidylethanolamine-binding protein (PEBP) family uncharacterized protein
MKNFTFTKTLVVVMALGLGSTLFYCNKKESRGTEGASVSGIQIKSEDFTDKGVIPDRFDGSEISPSFTISNLDPVKYKYLSIIMIDMMNLAGTDLSDLADNDLVDYLPHWQQSNIDISKMIENGKITIVSSDIRFNNAEDDNSFYILMTPLAGIHKYAFYFFLHDAPKNTVSTNMGSVIENFYNFTSHFTAVNDVKLNVWGVIKRIPNQE